METTANMGRNWFQLLTTPRDSNSLVSRFPALCRLFDQLSGTALRPRLLQIASVLFDGQPFDLPESRSPTGEASDAQAGCHVRLAISAARDVARPSIPRRRVMND